MQGFLEALKTQRWDDHRYYHHSRINQSLHFLSALSFIASYVAILTGHFTLAALLGWLLAMVSRQSGHFFFEPKGYDEVNQATHEHKEEIKVGYNLRRKVVLHVIWALAPVLLWLSPTFFGIWGAPAQGWAAVVDRVAALWIAIGIGALLFRTVHLFFLRDVQTGLAWLTKILTDPFHDVMLYYKAPLFLLRGELMDPMRGASHRA